MRGVWGIRGAAAGLGGGKGGFYVVEYKHEVVLITHLVNYCTYYHCASYILILSHWAHSERLLGR